MTFERTAGIWRSRSMHQCGFIPIRGAGGVAERNIPLGDTGITIRIDDGQPADATARQRALSSGPVQIWTGIEVAETGQLDFWLAGMAGFFRLQAGADAVTRSGLVAPAFSWGAMGPSGTNPQYWANLDTKRWSMSKFHSPWDASWVRSTAASRTSVISILYA